MTNELLPLIIITLVLAINFAIYSQFFKKDSNKLKELTDEEINEAKHHEDELLRYLKRPKSNPEIGLMYERYIGYLLEVEEYEVQFCGARKGMRDSGRDLIAKNTKTTLIIQTKYWAKTKVIGEKHIHQLYGSTELYKKSHKKEKVKAVFYATTKLSSEALEAATSLGVEVRKIDFDRSYPLIKCNIGRNGKRIFHLPPDEYYDTIKIEPKKGEFYAKTIVEAMSKNFRRAIKYRGKRSA